MTHLAADVAAACVRWRLEWRRRDGRRARGRACGHRVHEADGEGPLPQPHEEHANLLGRGSVGGGGGRRGDAATPPASASASRGSRSRSPRSRALGAWCAGEGQPLDRQEAGDAEEEDKADRAKVDDGRVDDVAGVRASCRRPPASALHSRAIDGSLKSKFAVAIVRPATPCPPEMAWR